MDFFKKSSKKCVSNIDFIPVVILFAVSNDIRAAKNQLKLLSIFAGQLGHHKVIENLKSAKNVEEVIAAFDEKL